MWKRVGGCTLRLIAGAFSAAMLAASQPPDGLGALALVAGVPWLIATRSAGRVESVLLGGFVGSLYGALAVPWIPDALQGLGASYVHSLLGFIATVAWAKAIMFGVAGFVQRELRATPIAAQVAGVAAVLAFGEWVHTRWAWGLPAAFVGHAALSNPGVAQLAASGGVELLSAFFVGSNVAIADTLVSNSTSRRCALAFVATWLALAIGGLPLARAIRTDSLHRDPAARILVIQPDFPRWRRWDPAEQSLLLAEIGDYTSTALSSARVRPGVILWPENLLTSRVDLEPELREGLIRRATAWQTPIVTGIVRSTPGTNAADYRSSVVWIDPGQPIRKSIDKSVAVPVVESNRNELLRQVMAPLFGRAALWPKVEEVGHGGALSGSFTLTPALCFEVLFPDLVAARRPESSVAIVNLADDSWVEGDGASRQLTAWGLFRAIEQRASFIRVAHGGLSLYANEFGEVIEELPVDQFASRMVEVRPSKPPGVLERAVLAGLPIIAFVVVWWACGWMPARRGSGSLPATSTSRR